MRPSGKFAAETGMCGVHGIIALQFPSVMRSVATGGGGAAIKTGGNMAATSAENASSCAWLISSACGATCSEKAAMLKASVSGWWRDYLFNFILLRLGELRGLSLRKIFVG